MRYNHMKEMIPKFEAPATKESGQALLFEKFQIRDTAGFRAMLKNGEIDRADECLQFIIDNKNKLPQYHTTWDNWLRDRKQEISQEKLFQKFGIRKTSDFVTALTERPEIAKNWLQFIIDNRELFPQYRDNWFEDRQLDVKQITGVK